MAMKPNVVKSGYSHTIGDLCGWVDEANGTTMVFRTCTIVSLRLLYTSGILGCEEQKIETRDESNWKSLESIVLMIARQQHL